MNLDIDKLILFCSIIDYGKGSKALKLSKKVGAIGGTVFLGKGTVRNELLNILGFSETRKEICITVIDEELEDVLYDEMYNNFSLNKPNHGIAFSMALRSFMEIGKTKYLSNTEKKGVKNVDYESIFIIVGKGLSDKVLDAAKAGGSRGGTVIYGRGSGSSEKEKLFNIEIEPEKDIILILSKAEDTDRIIKSVKRELDIYKPDAGIIFTLDVKRALGLYEEE